VNSPTSRLSSPAASRPTSCPIFGAGSWWVGSGLSKRCTVFIGAEISGLGAASMLRLMHSARIPLEFAPGAILSLAGKIENVDKENAGKRASF
jgi:hypothetical protein